MDTKQTHTPGPWLSLSDDEEHVHISSAVDGSWAAKERYIGRVTKRNAPLVKAAPALLAALKECSDFFIAIDNMHPERNRGSVGRHVRDLARAAIAQATKETP